MNIVWIAIGWLCIGLAIAGIALPLLPTTPFLLLAAIAFSRGSERLHHWLLNHPRFGPPIQNWQRDRSITRRTKIAAIGSMLALLMLSAFFLPGWIIALQGGVMTVVAAFLWRQREPK